MVGVAKVAVAATAAAAVAPSSRQAHALLTRAMLLEQAGRSQAAIAVGVALAGDDDDGGGRGGVLAVLAVNDLQSAVAEAA